MLDKLLSACDPALNEGVFVYALAPDAGVPTGLSTIATFREKEGLTLILAEDDALRAGLVVLFRAAWITLRVQSELNAVGLTAACANALAEAGVACNVVAAVHHDHIFVPFESALTALAALLDMRHRATVRLGR